MNTNNELCKGCCNVGTDRNKWPCVDCCEADRFNEPKPEEANADEQISSVIGMLPVLEEMRDYAVLLRRAVYGYPESMREAKEKLDTYGTPMFKYDELLEKLYEIKDQTGN